MNKQKLKNELKKANDQIEKYQEYANYFLTVMYDEHMTRNIKAIHKRMNYIEGERFTLILSAPKTASTTISHSLRIQKIPNMEKLHRFGFNLDFENYYFLKNKSLTLWKSSCYYFQKNINLSDCRIITLIREPIARTMSLFFFKLRDWNVDDINNIKNDAELFEKFLVFFKRENSWDWFDNIFMKGTNIDMYQYSVNPQKGYSIIKHDKIDLLILKVETSQKLKENILQVFIGKKDFKLINQNSASEQAYSKLYADFKSKVTFDKNFLDEVYSAKYVTHFYTEEEIVGFKRKWSKNEGFDK